jgi:hypothetical protein
VLLTWENPFPLMKTFKCQFMPVFRQYSNKFRL